MSKKLSTLGFGLVTFILANASFAQAPSKESVVPKPLFGFWNDDDMGSNNCYNYATNRKTNSFAQPGEASNHEYRHLTCKDVYEAASTDLGLTPAPFFEFHGKKDDLLVALVVAPNYDFHWYRRGDDNFWTHKMGGTEAQNLDNSHQPITSPETADRGRYTDFCGYFRIKDFPRDQTEQNAGYVRIGDMKQLPPETKSTVEALLFSGRRNPKSALRALLGSGQFPLLQKIAHDLHSGKLFGTKLDAASAAFAPLGDRGVQINDREGVLFPKGSSLQLRGDVLIFQGGQKLKVATRVTGLAAVVKQIYQFITTHP